MKPVKTIKFIIGAAGCAKTTTLIKISKQLGYDFICLAFTHNAVNNLVNKYFSNGLKTNKQIKFSKLHFKTIHSFFKINPETNVSAGDIIYPGVLLIDEFSLIPATILNIIFKSDCDLILSGDPIQLNPVNKHKSPIDYKKFLSITDALPFNQSMLIADHLNNNIYVTNEYQNSVKMVLKKNYRSGSNVMSILDQVLNDKYDFKQCVGINEIESDYTIISSKYKHLKTIYSKLVKKQSYRVCSKIGDLYFDIDDKFILTENLNVDFSNGDEVIIKSFDDITLTICGCDPTQRYSFDANSIVPLLPTNFITIHKSQGLSFDKVLVILDDLYEITMLYTAITRARTDVKFIILNKLEENNFKDFNNAFLRMRSIVYQSQPKSDFL